VIFGTRHTLRTQDSHDVSTLKGLLRSDSKPSVPGKGPKREADPLQQEQSPSEAEEPAEKRRLVDMELLLSASVTISISPRRPAGLYFRSSERWQSLSGR
jgi:hypothetical protein